VIAYANAIGCKTLFYGIGANDAATITGMKSGQPASAFTATDNFKKAGGRFWLMGGNATWLNNPGVVPTPIATYIE
jgi:hypothetical protein